MNTHGLRVSRLARTARPRGAGDEGEVTFVSCPACAGDARRRAMRQAAGTMHPLYILDDAVGIIGLAAANLVLALQRCWPDGTAAHACRAARLWALARRSAPVLPVFLDAKLRLVQPSIHSVASQQFLVRSLLADPVLGDHHNAIGTPDRGQAMGDDQCRAPLGQFGQRLLDRLLGLGVER
jgi:hypothetical protein